MFWLAPVAVQLTWVRGHTNNRENERCDQLALEAAQRSNLPEDKGYEEAS
ncbi:MAG: RNase H family protein [Dehalococcoidia bacterium]